MAPSSFRLLTALAVCVLPACSTLFDDSLAGGDASPSTCGNAIVDAGEACDDAVPLVQTCADLLGPSATGNARCTSCGIDLRGCVGGGGRAGGGAAGGGAGGSGGGAGGATAGAGGEPFAGFGGRAGAAATGGMGGEGGASNAGSGGSMGGVPGLGGVGGAGGGGAFAGGQGGTTSGAGGVAAGSGAGAAGSGGSAAGTGGASSGNGGAAGTSAGVGGTGGASGQAGAGQAGTGGTPIGVGGATSCSVECGPFLSCVDGSCVCPATSEQIGAGCWPKVPKPAAQRTKEEVCAARKMGEAELDPGGVLEDGGMCGPWGLRPGKLADLANRLAYFRWLAGVGPLRAATGGEDPHRVHARCAAATAFESGPLSPGGTCSSPEVVTVSKRSSRITGPGAETPFDVLVRSQTGAAFGHVPRRIVLSPLAAPFFFGFFGPSEVQRGSCLEVPIGPALDPADLVRTIWPPAGFVPIELADAPWSIGPVAASGTIDVSVVRSPPGTSLETEVVRWSDMTTGGPVALIERVNWVPVVARSYAITVSQEGAAPFSYTFEPIDCGP